MPGRYSILQVNIQTPASLPVLWNVRTSMGYEVPVAVCRCIAMESGGVVVEITPLKDGKGICTPGVHTGVGCCIEERGQALHSVHVIPGCWKREGCVGVVCH